MRNLLVLFLLGTIFLLFSCGDTILYDVLIKNESSKVVSYTYDGDSNTLVTGDSKAYEVEAHTEMPKNISVPGAMSVKMSRIDDTYIFVDVDEITLSVTNLWSNEVTLSAGKYIDDSGLTEMIIPASGNKTAKIFTSNPNFTTDSELHNVTWELIGNTMNVVIR